MNDAWNRAATIFEAALLLPPDERSRFVAERAGADVELQREVESLLKEDDAAGNFLTPPDVSSSRSVVLASAAPALGSRVGEFELLRKLGSGGMGSVYEAEQAQPKRRVALKLLGPLGSSASSRQRFTQEATLLARMNHPGIAQVYAAGVDGEMPYLAMELVHDGLPISEFARRRALDIRAVVALLRQVCAGVAHGHAKGVVHRDLKPSNVLVDGRGQPKLIDFGIARALDDGDEAHTRATRTGDLIGTLQYMSPEQAQGSSTEIDAQSDVYALGLMLYELVAGRRAHRIEGLTLTSALKAIAERDIAPLRQVREDAPAELEWIARKALEKERSRRYASVSEFDSDLARFLAHEPVLAGPPSRVYELKKFVRRNRVPVTALIAVFAALAVGLVMALASRDRERVARTEAEQRRNEAETARGWATQRTRDLELEMSRNARLVNFQRNLLMAANTKDTNYDVRVIDVLDRAREDLATDASIEPDVKYQLHAALGEAYENLGRPAEAIEQFDVALQVARALASVHVERLAALERLALGGRAKNAPTPEIAAEARALVERNESRLESGSAEAGLARLLLLECLRATDDPELGAYLRSTRSHFEERNDEDGLARVDDQELQFLVTRGQFKAAEPLARALLERSVRLVGAEHSKTLGAMTSLADVLVQRGATEEALELARQVVAVRSRRAGPEHVETLLARMRVANAFFDAGQRSAAMVELQDLRTRIETRSDRGSRSVLQLETEIATGLARAGAADDAVHTLRDVVQRYSEAGLGDSAEALKATQKLVYSLARRGDFDEALALGHAALLDGTKRLGVDHESVAHVRGTLATVLQIAGRFSESTPLLEEQLASDVRRHGVDSDAALGTREKLAHAWSRIGRDIEAEAVLRDALVQRLRRFGPRFESTLFARYSLARLLEDGGRGAEAEAEYCLLLQDGADVVPDPGFVATYYDRLSTLRLQLGRSLDALAARADAVQFAERAFPPDAPARVDAELALAERLQRMGSMELALARLEPLHARLSARAEKGQRVMVCRRLLAACFDAVGRTAEAAELRERISSEIAK